MSEEHLRDEIWNTMLDFDMNARYWEKIFKRYYDRDVFIKIFLAIMSSGTVASWMFWKEHQNVWQFLSLISAVISIMSPILNYAKLLQSLSKIRIGYINLLKEAKLLWNEYEMSNSENIEENKKILRKLIITETEISKIETSIEDKKLLLKCFKEVKKSRGI